MKACGIMIVSDPGRQRGLSQTICSVASSALFHVSHGPSQAFVFVLGPLPHGTVRSNTGGSADEHCLAGREYNFLSLPL